MQSIVTVTLNLGPETRKETNTTRGHLVVGVGCRSGDRGVVYEVSRSSRRGEAFNHQP